MLHLKCLLLPWLLMVCSHHMISADIDHNNCVFSWGSDGNQLNCNRGYVTVSMCRSDGTGEGSQCGPDPGYPAMIYCCKDNTHDPENPDETCHTGEERLCSENMVVTGMCGSGLEPTCNDGQDYSTITCCDDHNMSLDPDNGVWVYAGYGVLAHCPQATAGCGFCVNGDEGLCTGRQDHGIYCCPYL